LSASFTSTTVPVTGEKISDTDFVDSNSAQMACAITLTPTSGSSTYTTSPSESCAKSVMPMRARGPSTATHSCSSLYRSSSG